MKKMFKKSDKKLFKATQFAYKLQSIKFARFVLNRLLQTSN